MTTAISSNTSFPTPKLPSDASSSSASSGSGANGTGTISDAASLQKTYSQFLTLLTTQLKHQDPTQPMDTAQFTSQLVSFSQVEQQLKTNSDLDQLVASSNNNQASLGLSYIGKNVAVQGNQFDFNPKTEASVSIGYNLSAAPATDNINIVDSKGNTVYSTTGSLTAGQNSFSWNGLDNSGSPVPAGTYTVQVNAMDAQKTAVDATTSVPGTVSGMQTASDGSVQLMVGSQLVPLTSISAVY